MRSTLPYLLAPALVFHVGAPSAAFAGEPRQRVEQALTSVSSILNDPDLAGPEREAKRKQKVREVILDTFDFEAMSQTALGSHGQTLPPEQRREFESVFGQLFEQSYNSLVLQFFPGNRTTYGEESVEGDRALIRTTIIRRNDELPVDYRLNRKGERWLVADVVVDGISIARNYQAQFDRVIRTSSFEALLEKIRLKVARR